MAQKRFKTPTVGVVYDITEPVGLHINGTEFNVARYETCPSGKFLYYPGMME